MPLGLPCFPQLLPAAPISSSPLSDRPRHLRGKKINRLPPPGSPQASPIRPPTWADKHCPPAVLPFVKLMRADAPIGTYLERHSAS